MAYLEGLLLLHGEPSIQWAASDMARRLYVSDKVAQALLEQLCASGFAHRIDTSSPLYRYQPLSEILQRHVDQLALAYAEHLVEITKLIHSKSDRAAHQFADAFKLRKED
ncbi:MAG: hypothetical protein ABW049_11480 [Spongiibacteraceae bacterium]